MQALQGVRVVDFTHVFAGPFCTSQLGALGADVIKVEATDTPDMMRPEGADPTLHAEGRGSQFIAQSGNKRSLAVSLTSEAGREVVGRLIAGADVVVENFRPGVMARFGLDAESLRERHPRVITCSISGYGQTGPKRHHPAYDNVIQAFSGMMAMTGEPDGGPTRVSPPVLDYGTGAQAALAIVAALLRREHTGEGQRIDVSMLDCAMMLMSNAVVDTQAMARAPARAGNHNPERPAYGSFDTAAGQVMIGAYTAAQTATLFRVLGHDDEADALDANGREHMIAFTARGRALVSTAMLTDTADHWEHTLNAAGVPAARVRDLAEALAEPQTHARHALANGLQPSAPDLNVPVAGFETDKGGPDIRRPAPRHGEHTAALLHELGYADDDINRLVAANAVTLGPG
ncbi:MAG: CoA transferase [Pseudomonadota bacterium]